MSDGVASAREVGLDSGKITGRRLFSAMARTICSENEPGWPDTPIKRRRLGVAHDVEQRHPAGLLDRP